MPSAYNWTADALSRSSYTLYRVHVPFLVFLNAWIGQARWIPTPGHKLIGCAIFAVVMLYAQWSGSFFEKRTNVLRARVKSWFLGGSGRASEGERGEGESREAESHPKAVTSA